MERKGKMRDVEPFDLLKIPEGCLGRPNVYLYTKTLYSPGGK